MDATAPDETLPPAPNGQVGGTFGANFQSNAWVFGVETDLDYSTLDGKSSNLFCASVGFGAAQCETKNTWLWTVRGRFGYAADRVLFYGTGGGALGNVEAGVSGGFDTSTKLGWTAGAGIEWALWNSWSIRLEYDYYGFGTRGVTFIDNVSATVGPLDIKQNIQVVKLGVNLHIFAGSVAPLGW